MLRIREYQPWQHIPNLTINGYMAEWHRRSPQPHEMLGENYALGTLLYELYAFPQFHWLVRTAGWECGRVNTIEEAADAESS